jgi:hypothetical protein
MKRNIYNQGRMLTVVLFLTVGFISCKKGEPVKTDRLFGAVAAELASLPGTPVMDVYFNNKLLPDTLAAGSSIGITSKVLLASEQQGTLSFKKHGTDSLLLDTVIKIPKEKLLSFRLAYSTDLGIKDFLDGSSSVSADSVQIQIFNNLTSTLPEGVNVDGYLTREYNNGSGTIDDIAVLPGLSRKTLSKAITVGARNTDGTTYTYVLRLKDTATGLFLTDQTRFKRDAIPFPVDIYGGKSIMINLVQKLFLGGQAFDPQISAL